VDAKRAIPELSIDTQTLERLLASAGIGDIVPYADLSTAIGRDVQADARGCLNTARKRLHKHSRVVFGVVTNVGIKRLNDEGKVGAAGAHIQRGRRQFIRARAAAVAVDDFDALPNEAKVEHNYQTHGSCCDESGG
jgi:hypothetical protein